MGVSTMMYWQMTLIWWLLRKSYLHDIWLVELLADLHKAGLSYHFQNKLLTFERFCRGTWLNPS
jgi:hypothetical protein